MLQRCCKNLVAKSPCVDVEGVEKEEGEKKKIMADGSNSKSKWVVRVVEAPPALCIVGVSSSVQRSQAIERCPSKL